MTPRRFAWLALALVGLIAWLVFSTGPRDGEEASPQPGSTAPEAQRTTDLGSRARPTLESSDTREAAPTAEEFGRYGEPRGELTVRVVLADGSAAGEGVRAWIEDENSSPRALESAADQYHCNVAELEHAVGAPLTLDERAVGRTLSPRSAVRVAARAPGLAGWSIVAPDERECVVELAPSHDLAFRLIDATGRPCAGAMVAAWRSVPTFDFDSLSNDRRLEYEPSFVVQADASGLALVRDLESHVDLEHGRWRFGPILVASDPEVWLVEPQAVPDKPLVFRLAPGAAIEVVASRPDGKPTQRGGFVFLKPAESSWPLVRAGASPVFPGLRLRDGRARFDYVGADQTFSVRWGEQPWLSIAVGDVLELSRGERRVVSFTLPD